MTTLTDPSKLRRAYLTVNLHVNTLSPYRSQAIIAEIRNAWVSVDVFGPVGASKRII